MKNLTFKKYITECNISALVLVRSITTVFKGQAVHVLIMSLEECIDFLKISSCIKAIWILYMVKPSQSTWTQRKTKDVLEFKSQHQKRKQLSEFSALFITVCPCDKHIAGTHSNPDQLSAGQEEGATMEKVWVTEQSCREILGGSRIDFENLIGKMAEKDL